MTQPTLLMTRPRPAAARFVARLEAALLGPVVYAPLIEIVARDVVPDLTGYAGVIFSSSHAVAAAPDGAGGVAYCVGAQTRAAAEAAGWQAEMSGETATELTAMLIGAAVRGPLLHLAGHHRRGDIAGTLSAAGLPCDAMTLYDQHVQPLTTEAKAVLRGNDPVLVPLFSPRTAAQFAAELPGGAVVTVLALSDAVAEPLRDVQGIKCHVVAAPTGKDMVFGVENLLRRTTLA